MTFSSCTDPPCVTCALQINPSLRSFTPVAPALFKVGMGKGYLELPQGTACCVEVAQKGLSCIIPSSNHTRHGYQHVTVATYLLSSVCPCPVEIPEGKMSPSLLDSSGVYVLDCGADIFVWYVWMYTCVHMSQYLMSPNTLAPFSHGVPTYESCTATEPTLCNICHTVHFSLSICTYNKHNFMYATHLTLLVTRVCIHT